MKLAGFVLGYSGFLVDPLVVDAVAAIAVVHCCGFVLPRQMVFENVHLEVGLAGAMLLVLDSVLGSIQLMKMSVSEALGHSVVANSRTACCEYTMVDIRIKYFGLYVQRMLVQFNVCSSVLYFYAIRELDKSKYSLPIKLTGMISLSLVA